MTLAFYTFVAFAAFCVLYAVGLFMLHGLKRFHSWFFATLPEEHVMPPVEPKPDEDMPTTPALHRWADMHYRYQTCGHHVFEWCAVKGQCLQCVAEGRQAAKDMGRNNK